jgi:hypothetical protein
MGPLLAMPSTNRKFPEELSKVRLQVGSANHADTDREEGSPVRASSDGNLSS